MKIMIDREEEFWRQKAACNLFVHGDRNSKFYQACIKKKRESKFITKIKYADREFLYDEDQIGDSGVKYFKQINAKGEDF